MSRLKLLIISIVILGGLIFPVLFVSAGTSITPEHSKVKQGESVDLIFNFSYSTAEKGRWMCVTGFTIYEGEKEINRYGDKRESCKKGSYLCMNKEDITFSLPTDNLKVGVHTFSVKIYVENRTPGMGQPYWVKQFGDECYFIDTASFSVEVLAAAKKPEKKTEEEEKSVLEPRLEKLPPKKDFKERISKTKNIERKLFWEKLKEIVLGEEAPKIGQEKTAYMFIQPYLTDFELFSLSGEMAKWDKYFKDLGYKVTWLEWNTESLKRAFTDPNIGAFDYYGHNGLDTEGSWLSKRIFKLFRRTPAIFGNDADNLRNLIFNYKCEEYEKTMSLEEARRKAQQDIECLGLDFANIHACYSANNDSLMEFFVKTSGTFRGHRGPYHGFWPLNTIKTKE